jgi:hypothetical protein
LNALLIYRDAKSCTKRGKSWFFGAIQLFSCVAVLSTGNRLKICKMMKLIPERKATGTSHLSKPHILHGGGIRGMAEANM